MMHYIKKNVNGRSVSMIVLFFMLICAFDLYANETKTELDINQYVFQHAVKEATSEEMSYADYVGNNLLLGPVNKIKESTERVILNNAAKITHDEISGQLRSKRCAINKKTNNGPKISLTF